MSENKALVEYESDSGKVKLSPTIVKNYLVSGNGNVTDQEIVMFLNLCKYQKLNPFLREAYLIKFGTEPATIVTGKEVFTKRAAKHENFAGFKAGVIVADKQGNLIEREGQLVLKNEELIAGWAEVYRNDYKVPIKVTASISEYMRTKKDGTPMASWKNMPATMIRKVALVQALREAFPDQFQGLYSQEEMPVDNSMLPENPVQVEESKHEQKEAINVEYEPVENADLATEKQIAKIHALRNELKMPEETYRNMLGAHGAESSKDLTKQEASNLIKELSDLVKEAG